MTVAERTQLLKAPVLRLALILLILLSDSLCSESALGCHIHYAILRSTQIKQLFAYSFFWAQILVFIMFEEMLNFFLTISEPFF